MTNQKEFWNRESVINNQNIQKTNPYGSEAHKNAFEAIKSELAESTSTDFANEYFGNYED